MRQPLVAGNWKMNGTRESVSALIEGLKDSLAGLSQSAVAVCPPYIYLQAVVGKAAGSHIQVGAQDLSVHAEPGAYTGEICASMLLDSGCQLVIIGHSERRHGLGETNTLVAEKVQVAQQAGLIPILCVGELLEEREAGDTEAVIKAQLDAVADIDVQLFADSVIAYEPVWAIGTGKTASPEQAQDVHAFIRAYLAGKDADIAEKTQILYGGSVKPDNAATLFAMSDIDGGLIGGASLTVDDFTAICQAAESVA